MLIFQINMQILSALTVLDTVINGILTSKMATCVMAPHISLTLCSLATLEYW